MHFAISGPVWRKGVECRDREAPGKVSVGFRNLSTRNYKQVIRQKKVANTRREVGKCLYVRHYFMKNI